jgi:S1-C subfamily serine protease
MRAFALLLLALLASCSPAPEAGLKLVTIESADAGLSLRELPPQTLRSIGLNYGLAVVKTGGLAERAGLKVGDVVFGVNQKKVESLEEFNRALSQQQGGRSLDLLVRRGATDFYVAVDLAGGAPKTPIAPRETLLRT